MTLRELDEKYEHWMATTRWCPMVVVGIWFLVIGAAVKAVS